MLRKEMFLSLLEPDMDITLYKELEPDLPKGEIQVAHILIPDTTATGKSRIDTIYGKLEKGEDFGDLAKRFSSDTGSKNRGGRLGKFGSGRMVKSFEDAAFAINKEGEYSKPFKTRFGWHIAKLIKKYPVGSFEEMKKDLTEKVKRSGRGKLSDQAVVKRLKAEYNIEEFEAAKWIMKRKDIRAIPKDSLQDVILKINGKEIKQKDFVAYTINRRHLSIDVLFDNFRDQEVLTYFKENLKNTNKEFAATLKEYEDGLLLFELMQKKIWNKSNDSTALKSYFDTHLNQYNSKELAKVRGKVMNDFQKFLEDEWIKKLRANNSIKINKSVLKKLVKYYRKES